ncbi:MAG TPA: hypothetical protein PLQ69_02700 [Paludibacter sp.]|nr:hypothetical protein [Paludibacter sp.]
MADGHTPIVASDGQALLLLQQEFPNLDFIELPSYKIRYNRGKSQITAILRSLPAIVAATIREHNQLKKTIRKHHICQVISDNRFGLWNKNVHSIYMTHQLMIKMPDKLKFLEKTIWRIHRWVIHKYDECHIPDFEGKENLSGDLSHLYPLPKNAQFIGPLSRFKLSVADAVGKPIKKYHTVAIISGPEPQRSLFEQELISRFEDAQKPILLIQGKPQTTDTYQIQRLMGDFGKIDQVPHLASQTFAYYLLHAEKIICRSGYSTIMDLHTLNCLHKAEFIPTPGQTEQEYLAEYHKTKKMKKDLKTRLPKI